jgi:DNA (cytosine-5)-methyltransferase 1
MEITYAEYFLGIGAPGKGIKRVTERHGDTCRFIYGFEIDKYARNSFAAIHNVDESLIYHDITDQPDNLPYVDVVFYSPPCQSFSLAGKREGTTVDKGNLFYNALQGIIKSNPKYAIMENVANLKNQFADDFNAMLRALEDAGYTSYAKVLNSKHYGIPQNRERIFVVSIRNDLYENGCFEWPVEIPLKAKLKDVLEDEVDEKYYINKQWKITKGDKDCHDENEIAQIIGGDYKATRTITDTNKISRCLDTMTGGQREPKILVKPATKNGYETAHKGIFLPCIAVSRGRDKNNSNDRTKGNKNLSQTLEFNQQGTSNALTTVQKDNYVVEPKLKDSRFFSQACKTFNENKCNYGDSINAFNNNVDNTGISPTLTTRPEGFKTAIIPVTYDYRIRKLTPLECFRLQGFDDIDYYKAVKAYDDTYGLGKDGKTKSDSQMYKRAGNSITVNVEEEILENLLYKRKQGGNQITLF